MQNFIGGDSVVKMFSTNAKHLFTMIIIILFIFKTSSYLKIYTSNLSIYSRYDLKA